MRFQSFPVAENEETVKVLSNERGINGTKRFQEEESDQGTRDQRPLLLFTLLSVPPTAFRGR
jgi:hypothetical protein